MVWSNIRDKLLLYNLLLIVLLLLLFLLLLFLPFSPFHIC
jgi:hypothetical protein